MVNSHRIYFIKEKMSIFSKEYKSHYKENVRVAWPVIMGQLGHMAASVADNAMVGNISSVQLAACAFANAIFFIIFIIAIGIAMGLTPLIGKYYGAGDKEKCSELLKNSAFINIAVSIVLTGLMLFTIQFFDSMGQPQEVVPYAKKFFSILAFSLIPYAIFASFKQFSDGLGLTKPGMIILISCNLLLIAINYLLIYGNFGFPRMEIEGAGWATLAARVMMAVMAIGYFFFHKDYTEFKNIFNKVKLKLEDIKDLLKIGVPIGMQYFLEVAAFAGGTLIIGLTKSSSDLAAHQIALNLASITFMTASGFAAAATIRMSNAIGEGDFRRMKVAGSSAFVMTLIFMTCTATLFIVFGNQLAGLYVKTNEPEVVKLAVQLLIIGGIFQLADGAQAVALGTLRGMEDVRIPTVITTISYWVLTIPVCYILAINFKMGASGVWWGYTLGLLFASILLYLRFEKVAKHIIKTRTVAIN